MTQQENFQEAIGAGIFVASRNSLSSSENGGVQWCTRDYLATLATAGFKIETVAYENDRSWSSRFARKLRPRPYRYQVSPKVLKEIETVRKSSGAKWIFLNNSEPLELTAKIRELFGRDVKVIYLSHGTECTDQINDIRLGGNLIPPHRRKPAWVGRLLFAEIEQRQHLDGVVCASEEDVLFERWLGVEHVCCLLRSIQPDPLVWKPVRGRIGTVGTLSHVPNVDGIRRLAAALEAHPGFRLRLVGRPITMGQRLAGKFKAIEYLGALSDDQLKEEAATWCAFLNPIFCQARGISTKLATALGWGLPVLTTVQGARGYRWEDSILPRAETAEALAAMAVEIAVSNDLKSWQTKSAEISKLAPNLSESGATLYRFLSGDRIARSKISR